MENMDQGLTETKWLLIKRPKIPEMPLNFLAKVVCLSQKVCDFQKKTLSGSESLVRV